MTDMRQIGRVQSALDMVRISNSQVMEVVGDYYEETIVGEVIFRSLMMLEDTLKSELDSLRRRARYDKM